MQEVTIPNLTIVPPQATAGEHITKPDQPKLPFGTGIICGKSGAGKSVAAVEFINWIDFDRVFYVGCNFQSNRALLERLGTKLSKEDIYTDCDDLGLIDDIRAKCEQEARDLEEYEKEMKRFRKLMNVIHSPAAMFRVEDDDLQAFYKDGDFQPPSHRWGGRKPKLICVIDDGIGSGIFAKPRKLNALSTFSRHLGSFKDGRPAIGLSLLFLVQTIKAQSGGLSKVIRNQAKLYMMFRSHSKKELEDLVEAVAGEIPKHVFKEVLKTALVNTHDFLYIDLNFKKEQPSMFRRNLDTYLIPKVHSVQETIDQL